MWVGQTSLHELLCTSSWSVERLERGGMGLPTPFPLRPLGDLCHERRLSVLPYREPERSFHYIGLEHVVPASGELQGDTERRGDQLRSRCRGFEPGDLLYARLRPYLNKVYLAPRERGQGICSTEFIVLVPDATQLRARFARAVLASPDFLDLVVRRQTGSTRPRIGAEELLALRVPVPPLPIQKDFDRFIHAHESQLHAAAETLARLRQSLGGAIARALHEGRAPSQPELGPVSG